MGLRPPLSGLIRRMRWTACARAQSAPPGDAQCPYDRSAPGTPDDGRTQTIRSYMRRLPCSAASQRRTGACYPALRCLPGRDFHPLVQSNLQDATRIQAKTCCPWPGFPRRDTTRTSRIRTITSSRNGDVYCSTTQVIKSSLEVGDIQKSWPILSFAIIVIASRGRSARRAHAWH